jgi:phospholipid/cholesterol/gamma-HCH transport system substrate-binding protein
VATQQQVRWSQLRVGITVVAACIILAILIFLMSGSTGVFSKTIKLRAYFDNAGGIREGSTVRLQGVDIGNVDAVRVVQNHNGTPVEMDLKVNTKYWPSLYKGSMVSVATEGVLGGSYIDIDSTHLDNTRPNYQARVQNGDELPIRDRPDIMDIVRSSQTTLQNIQTLVQRVDRIVGAIENGQGSIGKLINDPGLYNRLNTTLGDVQKMVGDISAGKGSVGKLIASDEIYNKANTAVDKLNGIIDEINNGNGTVGKLIKDPTLYNNANQTIAKANQLMGDINAGKGAIGKLTKDEAFAQKLDNTMTKVSALVDRLEAGEGSAGKLMRDPSLYNNLDQGLVEVRELVKAIRENPKRYLTIHFRVF